LLMGLAPFPALSVLLLILLMATFLLLLPLRTI